MAISAGTTALHLTGDLGFFAGGMDVGHLIGAFVKGVTQSGNTLTLTVQNASGVEEEVAFTPSGGSGTGATVTAGNADPTGGADGDAYIQIDGSNIIQAIWRNDSGTWVEYTIGTGSGTGDISAVTTEANSGLAGGAESGDVDLLLDIDNLPGQTGIAGGDHIAFDDASASVSKKITVQNLASHLAPTAGGLAPTTAGQLGVRIHGLPGLSTFEGTDEVVLTDDSATNKISKKATLTNFAEHLAGDGLTAATDGSISKDDPDAADVVVDASGFAGNLDSTDTDVQAALGTIDDLSLGGSPLALTTHVPEDVGDAAEVGTGTHAARADHVHRLVTDETLEVDDDGALGVSITDVVEHLQQRIQYYTNENDHSTDGSAAGQVYTTSRYPKNIAHVKAEVRPSTGSIYKCGIYTVNDSNRITAILGQSVDSEEVPEDTTRILTFSMLDSDDDSLGVPLAGDERIAVLIRRVGAGDTADTHLRHGSAAANSPSVSYADAENDFVLENHVIYEHEDPAVGNDTHSHGNFIRGNIRIFYTVVIDHGSLVGDGNVTANDIDSGSATDGQGLLADGSGGSAFEDLPDRYKRRLRRQHRICGSRYNKGQRTPLDCSCGDFGRSGQAELVLASRMVTTCRALRRAPAGFQLLRSCRSRLVSGRASRVLRDSGCRRSDRWKPDRRPCEYR